MFQGFYKICDYSWFYDLFDIFYYLSWKLKALMYVTGAPKYVHWKHANDAL